MLRHGEMLPTSMMGSPPLMSHMNTSLYHPAPQHIASSIPHHIPVSMDGAIDHRIAYGQSVIAIDHRMPPMRIPPDQQMHEHILANQRMMDTRRLDGCFNDRSVQLSVATGRIDGIQSPDKYSQVPRNTYTPLNNEDERANFTSRRPPDLMIINNTMAGPSMIIEKNSDIRANISSSSSLPRAPVSRRASEPPHLLGAEAYYLRNRSCDDLNPCESEAEYRDEWQRNRREQEDRETARSISRSRLRRDSFGEVVSRRSPSQDSIGLPKGGRGSPLLDRPQLDDLSRGDRYTPAHDTWSVTGPSSRASPTHDSPEHQVGVTTSCLINLLVIINKTS